MRPLFSLEDSSQFGRSVRNFVDRYPIYAVRPVVRRFDLSFQPTMDAYADQEDGSAARQVKKRNNAELVNHILKNFGNLNRLGDVGR
ncbi:hypothetical protein Ddc_05368 [Ditylenchus destructor]|nr:hypothetical protein Ddc_05368 [Ditylenchus destructor]